MLHGFHQAAMLAQRIGVEVATQDFAFAVPQRKQRHKRLLYRLPDREIDMRHLLFKLNGKSFASTCIERGLQQDMLLFGQ